MTLAEKARQIATEAHKGQVDKAGRPYIEHPTFVASLLSSDDEKAVAYLHDVIEDTSVTVCGLASQFPAHVVDAVVAMTKQDGEVYEEYLDRVKGNDLARRVKLADISHNMDLSRLSAPTDKDRARVQKYQQAVSILNT